MQVETVNNFYNQQAATAAQVETMRAVFEAAGKVSKATTQPSK